VSTIHRQSVRSPTFLVDSIHNNPKTLNPRNPNQVANDRDGDFQERTKVMINDAIHLFNFQTAISTLVTSNRNSFRVLFDEIDSD